MGKVRHMLPRMQTLTMSLAAAFLQSSCATSVMDSKCTVDGYVAAFQGMTTATICANFERELAASFGEWRPFNELIVTLTVQKRGAVSAQFSRRTGDDAHTYPVVSVDAIDRELRIEDLSRLAQASAQMLMEVGSAESGSQTSIAKGE